MNDSYIFELSAEVGENTENVENAPAEDVTGELLEGPTWEKTVEALGVMGKGMLGIFIVIGVIILTILALNKFTGNKKNKKSE